MELCRGLFPVRIRAYSFRNAGKTQSEKDSVNHEAEMYKTFLFDFGIERCTLRVVANLSDSNWKAEIHLEGMYQ